MRLDGKDVFFLTGTDEHGLKMVQTAAKEGLTPQGARDRNVPPRSGDGRAPERSNDDSSAPPSRATTLLAGDLAADGGERRHLSRQICRLVLGARRGLLRRERDAPRRGQRRLAAAGHAGRMGRGGELFLPLSAYQDKLLEALRERARLHRPGARSTRSSASSRAACRTCRSRAPPSTGASGAGRPRST
jgi:hypothetical protein